MGGIYEYAVETDSGAMIYTPSFIKIVLGIQKLIVGGGIHRHTDIQIHIHIENVVIL
jgi:hypothetical protein